MKDGTDPQDRPIKKQSDLVQAQDQTRPFWKRHPYQIIAPLMCRWWWFWEDVSEVFWPDNNWYPSAKWEDYMGPSQALIDAMEDARSGRLKKFELEDP